MFVGKWQILWERKWQIRWVWFLGKEKWINSLWQLSCKTTYYTSEWQNKTALQSTHPCQWETHSLLKKTTACGSAQNTRVGQRRLPVKSDTKIVPSRLSRQDLSGVKFFRREWKLSPAKDLHQIWFYEASLSLWDVQHDRIDEEYF